MYVCIFYVYGRLSTYMHVYTYVYAYVCGTIVLCVLIMAFMRVILDGHKLGKSNYTKIKINKLICFTVIFGGLFMISTNIS